MSQEKQRAPGSDAGSWRKMWERKKVACRKLEELRLKIGESEKNLAFL